MRRSWWAVVGVIAMVVALGLAAGTPAASAEPPDVLAWGAEPGQSAELGDGGSPGKTTVPVPVSGITGVQSLAAGSHHALALLEDGTVMIWGRRSGRGVLGQGSGEPATEATPVPVPGLEHVKAIAAGDFFSLALLEDGRVEAWGEDENGQLGNGLFEEYDATPTLIPGLEEVVAIAAGGHHALALLADGQVVAWGENKNGELGNGGHHDSDVPVPVSGLSEVASVAAGAVDSFAVLKSGGVESWGSNGSGGLGDGLTSKQQLESDVPVVIGGLSGVRAIAAGGQREPSAAGQAYAILEDGAVLGWGYNYDGSLGTGANEFAETTSPTPVGGLADVVAIAPGSHSGLALLADGSLRSWGISARLGNGQELVGSPTPTSVCGVTGAKAIAAAFVVYVAAPAQPLCATVESVTPGFAAAGTSVTLEGSNLEEVTGMQFGGSAASSFTVGSSSTANAVVPPDGPVPPGSGTVPVTVTGPLGTSRLSTRQDDFSYSEPPVMGRCQAQMPSSWTNAGCSIAGTGGGYEFIPKFEEPLQLAATTTTLEAANGSRVTCTAEKGTGEVLGVKGLGGIVLDFTGCARGTAPCASSGEPSGTIAIGPLTAALGIAKPGGKGGPSKATPGLAFQAPEGAPFAVFTCGGEEVKIRGSVIAVTPKNDNTASPPITFRVTNGKQNPERLSGGPLEILEQSVSGSAWERVKLVTKVKLTSSFIDFDTVA